MSTTRPLEVDYLSEAEYMLTEVVGRHGANRFELRLQILEAVSSLSGRFDLKNFQKSFNIKAELPCEELLRLASPVAKSIENSAIHTALALSALARESLQEQDRKSTGAYHTDFRLANRLAELASPKLTHLSSIIDPACGAGILLTAMTIAVCKGNRDKTSTWLAEGVCAADLSSNSLRATLLSLASLTDDIEALVKMRERWYCGDSLMADNNVWSTMAPGGFDAVIGNPPWEKVKLTKHEYLKSKGTKRNYGEIVTDLDQEHFSAKRNEVASYSRKLLGRYPNLGSGEPDLYIAFTELFFDLCKEQGVIAALVPGGLIRSQGTQTVRRKLFNESQEISISIVDNRAKFFAIDTRFKFLAVVLEKAQHEVTNLSPITLLHEHGTPTGTEAYGKVTIERNALNAVRPDMSLPEVKSNAEWDLFLKITKSGSSWGELESGWKPKFCREVDMTKERSKFLKAESKHALPLIEGRMIQAHRLGAKGHVSGTGRSAHWESFPIGEGCVSPQFWIHEHNVPIKNQSRIEQQRIGFCDIAGQTNERSLTASIIPAGVVCGNKVPTILFPDDPSEERMYVWTAIANSFVFDWLLRRVLTTTVNYFLLQSIPLPKLKKGGLPWNKLVRAVSKLIELNQKGCSAKTYEQVTKFRAEIETEVALAYGVSLCDMELIFKDFPLLDRGQDPLANENRSTITRDTVLSDLAERIGFSSSTWKLRVRDANALGSIGFVPSELAMKIKKQGMIHMPQAIVERILYKEIVEGDLRKLLAQSNDSTTGGGARDFRFGSFTKLKPAIKKMFPNVAQERRKRAGVNVDIDIYKGKFCWSCKTTGQTLKKILFLSHLQMHALKKVELSESTNMIA